MTDKNPPTDAVRVHTIKVSRTRSRVEKMLEESGERIKAASGGEENQNYLTPPLSFDVLYWLHENSSALRPCIDVYKTNIDGFGHHFPEKYTEDQIKAAIKRDAERETESDEVGREHKGEKTFKADIIKSDDGAVQWDATVEARYKELRIDIDREHDELKHFFEYATPGQSFIDTRKNTREDEEITGNAFWEVARSTKTGRPSKIYPAVAKHIRLCPAGEPVEVATKEQFNALDFRVVHVERRLRMYRQESESGGAAVYFKEFCDPRCVSKHTGTAYSSNTAMQRAEGGYDVTVPEATELIHFRIYSGSGPHGIPRHLGAYKLIMGLIEKDQVDLDYYTDNTIPPMAILVSGHSQMLGEKMIAVLTRTLGDAKKRGKSYTEVPIIEATSEPTSTLVAKIEFKNLMDARLKEATHLKYAEMCKEYIRQMFRLPKFLLGDAADVNRSTAVSILEMAEMQIFSGERKAFDFWMNHVFFPELDVRYHEFHSMGPQMEDLEAMAASLEKLIKSWLITPNEGRKHITDNTTLDVDQVKEEWGQRPPEATMSGRGYDPTTTKQGRDKLGVLAEMEREAEGK